MISHRAQGCNPVLEGNRKHLTVWKMWRCFGDVWDERCKLDGSICEEPEPPSEEHLKTVLGHWATFLKQLNAFVPGAVTMRGTLETPN